MRAEAAASLRSELIPGSYSVYYRCARLSTSRSKPVGLEHRHRRSWATDSVTVWYASLLQLMLQRIAAPSMTRAAQPFVFFNGDECSTSKNESDRETSGMRSHERPGDTRQVRGTNNSPR